MRTLALVAGVAATVVAAVVVILVVLSAGNTTSWSDLAAGDCFDLAGAVEGADGGVADVVGVDPVDCNQPHDAEVVAVGELNPDGDRAYPTDVDLFVELDRACAAAVPGDLDRDRFGVLPIAPDERTWDDREGRYVCVAVVIGGGTVSAPAVD